MNPSQGNRVRVALAAMLLASEGLEDDKGPVLKGCKLFGAEPVDGHASPCGRNDQCPCGSGKKFKKCCRKPHKGEWAKEQTN